MAKRSYWSLVYTGMFLVANLMGIRNDFIVEWIFKRYKETVTPTDITVVVGELPAEPPKQAVEGSMNATGAVAGDTNGMNDKAVAEDINGTNGNLHENTDIGKHGSQGNPNPQRQQARAPHNVARRKPKRRRR
ncbi:hypothetical protein CTA2_3872 [Colletotrichum tanaceti]|uniref:Uncharacterized protein n=1 Tax=Colletotrichum tanaceti TaxID=1306861 RepID=A0A4U6XEL2_9PEZI|nr:hypothetical protein CTA2_3872 [Colletotrichum tanaceti]TKW52337.1 hypothetical protein CTA1_7258 [Colletotrichum tanaceti]